MRILKFPIAAFPVLLMAATVLSLMPAAYAEDLATDTSGGLLADDSADSDEQAEPSTPPEITEEAPDNPLPNATHSPSDAPDTWALCASGELRCLSVASWGATGALHLPGATVCEWNGLNCTRMSSAGPVDVPIPGLATDVTGPYGLDSSALTTWIELAASVSNIAVSYVDGLATIDPEVPSLGGGYSTAGVITDYRASYRDPLEYWVVLGGELQRVGRLYDIREITLGLHGGNSSTHKGGPASDDGPRIDPINYLRCIRDNSTACPNQWSSTSYQKLGAANQWMTPGVRFHQTVNTLHARSSVTNHYQHKYVWRAEGWPGAVWSGEAYRNMPSFRCNPTCKFI